MSGTLYLVGVGPGDPDLLTLRAARIIAAVQVVAWPTTGEGAALALAIAGAHVAKEAQRLPVAIPMAVDPVPAQAAYDAAAETIGAHLAAGRDVAWLCEGDPLFYGSAIQLLSRLGDTAPVEVVPGVTSLTAAAAVARVPLAVRNETVKVLPAPLSDALLAPELATNATIAIIKVGRHLERIRKLLAGAGRADGAVVVEHATTARERITPLAAFPPTGEAGGAVPGGSAPYFSIILSPGAER